MTSLTTHQQQPEKSAAKLATRDDLTLYFRDLSRSIGADSYMLAAIIQEQDKNEARIVASNWIYDAIELAGRELIANIAQSSFSAAAGNRANCIPAHLGAPVATLLNGYQAKLLQLHGHGELYPLRLHAGRRRFFVIFSAARPGQIDVDALADAHMQACYALSQIPELLEAAAALDPLSDRERECLYWVSEGKTTDEVAVILGVSSNTVNSYIAHAIQKFSASNRAMAIATAIRSGII